MSKGESRREYMKAYRQANKEKIKIQRKAYYEANKEKFNSNSKPYTEAKKEKKKAYNKAYKEANKEKLKAYYENNKEKIDNYYKAYRESKKLNVHIVYCLPYYDQKGFMAYAGVTNQPHHRMVNHKREGRNTEDWFVLQICSTKEEALIIERQYHGKGYGGKHKRKR